MTPHTLTPSHIDHRHGVHGAGRLTPPSLGTWTSGTCRLQAQQLRFRCEDQDHDQDDSDKIAQGACVVSSDPIAFGLCLHHTIPPTYDLFPHLTSNLRQ